MKKLLLPVLLSSVLLAACESTTVAPGSDTSGIPTVIVDAPVNPDTGYKELDDPSSILYKRSVYFDFDRYDINPQYRPLVEAHASFLSKHPELSIQIAGNTDERGSREYNLALGQKRAEAVRRALVLLGARDSQIEAVSLGEEKPACTAATEECYAQNRRGDLQYPAK
ncbi:peptidoglycan-associated lipoprotein [Betaproteobacteria bacterium]|nr:peptidoglycan-associated lipoprotein [Betaproteobacteria bacterium]GHT95572.1 peptidoglycan-associated lipoprotein [Betaproteobacteria bacterium]GHU11546.1 peptidoglycan-associated lipoprotein [Betaproteobacteria bacterium]GHU19962.1 peptidoglycan-associated lipoprotein [Betaproteobacteria bacterium]